MPKGIESRIISQEERVMESILIQEALLKLLESKGLISRMELLEEIKKIKNTQAEKSEPVAS